MALQVVWHACYCGRAVLEDAGSDVSQIYVLLEDHVVHEDGRHFEAQIGQTPPRILVRFYLA
jgi:hypothetical protein